MIGGIRRPLRSTFRVSGEGEAWRVRLGDTVYGEFLSRGDAIRGACLGARTAEARGGKAEVLSAPGDERMPHYEPHFAD
ncbi:hypothetical protein [Phenylobacterium sp.]|uniref:hypothetical protein n=1 Tax=Phenylobacterium sp. TaxID=1871053 RepID=UPI002F921D37